MGQRSLTHSGNSSGARSIGSKPRCARCNIFHSGTCYEARKCFHCGQLGHIRSACPKLSQANITPSLSSSQHAPYKGT